MKAYRGMREELGVNRPLVAVPPGTPPLALFVRVKVRGSPTPVDVKTRFDIDADENGDVAPATGGLSVSRTWSDLPHFSIPRRLRRAHPSKNFKGATGGPDCRIWSHPVPSGFAPDAAPAVSFSSDLSLRVDQPGHGLVEPERVMPHTKFADAIAATWPDWSVDEPLPPATAGDASSSAALPPTNDPSSRPSIPGGQP